MSSAANANHIQYCDDTSHLLTSGTVRMFTKLQETLAPHHWIPLSAKLSPGTSPAQKKNWAESWWVETLAA